MALLQEIKVPLIAVNDTTLTVVEIAFSSGQKVNKGDLIMVFETSKTTYDVEAGADGFIEYLCELDNDYVVNEVVARIFTEASELSESLTSGASSAASPSANGGPSSNAGTSANGGHFPAHSPAAAAAETQAGRHSPAWEGETLYSKEAALLIGTSGIDKAVFKGRDLVGKEDVQEWLAARSGSAAAGGGPPSGSAKSGPAGSGSPGSGPAGNPATSRPLKMAPLRPVLPVDNNKVILQKLSSGKKREIEYLGEVQSAGLTSTIHTYVETEGIFSFINPSLKYLKDSLLPVILYEASRLLVDYPLLNGYFTGEAIALYKEINPGFAIDIDKGLKVLKISAAEQKGVGEIEEEIMRLSGCYLDDTLEINDLTDITFTVTDLSSEAVSFFHPLVNKMNSSILGISSIDQKLQRCTFSLTFDHRVTEGKSAARYLKDLKERLESYRPDYHQGLYQDIACFKCYKTLKEDLGGTGFARCITPGGKEGYICQSCLKGF
ncbi:MAG TPA: 2-oxo acid dehydrogenase subunit E2 [Puia sp.]|nr:2-oxo acid dehydrogenase subunit E2 [Puia sp.]